MCIAISGPLLFEVYVLGLGVELCNVQQKRKRGEGREAHLDRAYSALPRTSCSVDNSVVCVGLGEVVKQREWSTLDVVWFGGF